MKNTIVRRTPLVVAALAACVAWPATAQTTGSTTGTSTTTSPSTSVADAWRMPYQKGFWNYIGATVGGSDYDVGCVSGFDCDHHATAFKIVTGGKLYNALGLEVGYLNAGNGDIAGGHTRAQGANISLVAGLPLFGDNFGINGKIGTTYGWTRNNVAFAATCANGVPCTGYQSQGDRGWGLSYGAGATYAIASNIELRLDWDRNHLPFAGVGHQNVDMWTGGVNFRF